MPRTRKELEQIEREILAPFVALVMKRMSQQSTFEQAVRAGLAGILTSPEFIFLRETPGKLNDFALASRLSYFLWSSTPDDELLAAATAGKLSDPAALREQAERMLRSPKHAAFTTNFLGQWLGMRDIDFTEPSGRLYPEFDEMLKASMLRDIERGSITEAEHILGDMANRARTLGVDTPLLDLARAHVAAYEIGRQRVAS